MANQGLAGELINATEVLLTDGTDTYIQIQEIAVNIRHPETREPTTDAQVHYSYGPGDHTIEFAGLATSPEIATFINYTEIDANGAPNSPNWQVKYTDVSGTTKTVTLTGTLAPSFRIEKIQDGFVKFRGTIRITEEITDTDDVA